MITRRSVELLASLSARLATKKLNMCSLLTAVDDARALPWPAESLCPGAYG